MTRASLLRALRWALVVATIAAVAYVVADNVDQLDEVQFDLDARWLAIALLPAVLATALLPPAYRQLVLALHEAPELDRREARRLWWVSQAARYVPTSIPGFATRVVMTRNTGASGRAAGAALGLEMVVLILLLAGIGAAAAPFLPAWLRVVAGVGTVVALAVVAAATPWVARVAGRFGTFGQVRDRGRLVRALATYTTSGVLRAVRAPLVAVGVVAFDWDVAVIATVVAADGLGAAAGFIGATPAGLGTREATTVALLQGSVGLGRALTIAVALRVFDLAVELGWVGEASVRTVRASRGTT